MDWRKASGVWVVSVTLTVLILSAIIGTSIGVTEVAAQDDNKKDIIARTAPGEDATVQRGETVALGYPKGDTTRGYSWAYTWEVENGDTSDLLLHTGSADTTGEMPAHNGRITSFRATEKGEYTVSLTVRALDRSVIDTVSRQINVSGSSEQAVSYDKIREYAPVLRFEEDELYRPTRMEAIFENAELRKGVPSSEQELEVFNNANLYDVAVRERPEEQPSTDETFEFLLPIKVEETDTSIGGLWQGVFGEVAVDAGTDGLVDPNLLTSLDDPAVYPRTVYAQTVENVEFDPREFDPRGELPESGEYYEKLDSIGEVDLTSDTYTAVGYWMMYVNDPKPEHVRGFDIDSWVPFGKLAGHTGDASVVYILFNDNGNPEWMLNQQHKGGEYRRWEHVEQENSHPVVYVAQGAHTSFFGTGQTNEKVDEVVRTPSEGGGTAVTDGKEKPEHVYQSQYFNTPGRTDIFEVGVDVPRVGKIGEDVEEYVDIITDSEERLGWMPKDDYEVSILTGKEAWSDYTGDYLTYPHSIAGENPGATAVKIPQNAQNNPQFEDPGSWAEYRLFPDVAQIDAEFSDDGRQFNIPEEIENIQEDIVIPDGSDLDCTDLDIDLFPNQNIRCGAIEAPPAIVTEGDSINPDEADGSVGVNVINTGMQPHEFVLDLNADRQTESGSVGTQNRDISQPVAPGLGPGGDGGESDNLASYSFYVNSIYPKNVAGAEVPLDPLKLDEPGEYTVDAFLSMYTDAYQLDYEKFELEITEGLPEPSLEIVEEEVVDAGTINETGSTTVDVSITGVRQLPEDVDWTVSVGGEEVDAEPGLLGIDSPGSNISVRFTPPDKDKSGTYDVTVTVEAEDKSWSDAKEALLKYREPGKVGQTAVAMVVDSSGSMVTDDIGRYGDRHGVAKATWTEVINRLSSSDYVSVVHFSKDSAVTQELIPANEYDLKSTDTSRQDAGFRRSLERTNGDKEASVTTIDEERTAEKVCAGGRKPETIDHGSNIGAGLSDGIDEVMKAPDGVQKKIILLSDGCRNTGPNESAIKDMIRNRMNPNQICLHTNPIGTGADSKFMLSLNDAADCSESTENFMRINQWEWKDDIIRDFFEFVRQTGPSETLQREGGWIGNGETLESVFEVDESTTGFVLNVATDLGRPVDEPVDDPVEDLPGLEPQSDLYEQKMGADDNRTDTNDTGIEGGVGTLELKGTQKPKSDVRADHDVRLYRPDDTVVKPDDSQDIEVSTDDKTVYRVNDPEAGEWRYEIDGGDSGMGFESVVTANSLVQMDVETSSDEYYTESSADLTAKIFGSEPVTGAKVEADVKPPGGPSETVTFEEVSPGIYRATVDMENEGPGTYGATVKAVQKDENIERRESVSWNAEFAAPVSVEQSRVPDIEPGYEGRTKLTVESEALLGIRSVELGLSDFAHETRNATIPSAQVSMDRSHLVRSGETVTVDATVSVPENVPTGEYTANVGASVDDSGVTVDEVMLRVDTDTGTSAGTSTGCVNRRNAGRGEGDDQCPRDREFGRDSTQDGGDDYHRGTGRHDRGRDGGGERTTRRSNGR